VAYETSVREQSGKRSWGRADGHWGKSRVPGYGKGSMRDAE